MADEAHARRRLYWLGVGLLLFGGLLLIPFVIFGIVPLFWPGDDPETRPVLRFLGVWTLAPLAVGSALTGSIFLFAWRFRSNLLPQVGVGLMTGAVVAFGFATSPFAAAFFQPSIGDAFSWLLGGPGRALLLALYALAPVLWVIGLVVFIIESAQRPEPRRRGPTQP